MTQNIFKTCSFKDLSNWDIEFNIDKEIKSNNPNYKSVALRDLISPVREFVEINDEETYKRILVKRNGKGIEWRNSKPVLGINIKTKQQQLIKEGQIIVSKIGADSGAIAIVSNEFSGAIVSSDYYIFEAITNKIHPQYLFLISTSNQFVDILKKYSTGTVFTRIHLQTFLDIKIPLPSINKQSDLINKYNEEIKEANQLEKDLAETKRKIKEHFLEATGLPNNFGELEEKSFKIIEFQKLSDWNIGKKESIYQILNNTNFNLIKLGDFLEINKERFEPLELNLNKYRYLHVRDIDSSGITGSNFYSDTEIEELKKKVQIARKGDLLITTIFKDFPKIAMVTKEYNNVIVPNAVIVIKPKENIYNLGFYNLFFSTAIMGELFNEISKSTKSSLRLSKTLFKDILIVTPSCNLQKKIVIKSYKNYTEYFIKSALGSIISKAKKEARKEFENAILN